MIDVGKLIKALGANIKGRHKHLYSPTAMYGKDVSGEEALLETGSSPFVYAGDLTCTHCHQKVPNETIEFEVDMLKYFKKKDQPAKGKEQPAGATSYFTAEFIELHTLEKHPDRIHKESRDIQGLKGRQIDFCTVTYSTEEGVTGVTRLDKWACWLNLEDIV